MPEALAEGLIPNERREFKACVLGGKMNVYDNCTVGCTKGYTEVGEVNSDVFNCTAPQLDDATMVCSRESIAPGLLIMHNF